MRSAILTASFALVLLLGGRAFAAPTAGPEINPYECLGRYEAATRARSISQIEGELTKRAEPPFEPGEPGTVRAMKLCVIALLKSRLGHADAGESYEGAVRENPDEPGYEMFFGNYFSGFRGAHRPVLELAEAHYYRALEKIDRLRKQRALRDYHQIVEEWVRKRLLVLYQEDGQPLLPWKAYPQHPGGLGAPSVSASSQLSVSQDTHDFYFHNEMRSFSQEANFAASDLRARTLTALQAYNIVRAPLRYRIQNRVRVRQNLLGAFDFIHEYYHSPKSQITSFYLDPNSANIGVNDVTVQQIGGGYSRVFPLYPFFDLRLEASAQRVKRKGVVEFLPNREETFNLYEFKPSVSRFLGSDKLSLDGVYGFLNMADVVGGITDERQRKEYIRAARIEYAVYRPFVFPFDETRTATRGWYFFGGASQDDKVYGLRIVSARDLYAGTRFEGAGAFDLTLQGTYLTSRTTFVDPTQIHPMELTDPAQTFANYRTTALVQLRVINPDAIPGIPPSTLGFVPDMLNIVFPLSHDLGMTGRKDYENFRAGVEVWAKVFGTGIGGTALLFTAGYDYQYFYRIQKSMHMAHAALRIGWGGFVIARRGALLALSIAFAACGPGRIDPRPLPTRPSVRAEKVGAGYLVMEAAADVKVGANRRGDLVSPKVTRDFQGVPTSNSWWSSLIWQYDAANPYSSNLYAHPLVARAASDGLALSYPTRPSIAKREYMFRFSEDLRAGISGMKSPDTRVASYSDWAVTSEWRAEHGVLRATLGHGLPFVYFSKTDPAPVVVRVAQDKASTLEVWHEGDNLVGVSIGGHHYGIFGPTGSRWARGGTTFTSDLAGKDYFSIAVLPDKKTETLELFRRHAYAFVTKTTVSWRYDEPKAELETKFDFSTAPKEQGTDLSSEPLVALYRHQWLHTKAPLSEYEYQSPRGPMKIAKRGAFATSVKFQGVLPMLPEVDETNVSKLGSYVDDASAKDDLFPNGFGPTPGKDAYWIGKSLGRNTSLLLIADQIGNDKAKARLLSALKNQLEDWFDGHRPADFYYDNRWHTVVARPASYGSGEEINDHHFHYGYFVGAAATVTRFDPAWGARWGRFVELLLRDVANWDRSDGRFPFLRYMDPYAGHSWANGPAQFEEGNNQEASSEDINLSASAILWGAVTENRAIRDLGIFLYVNQVAAIEQYWFDIDRQVFPKGFDYRAAAMVWGAGAKYDTWFDQDPVIVHGINFLPFTGASLYLGRHPEYVSKNFGELYDQSRGIVNTWRDYAVMYLALANPRRALEMFEEDPYFEPEFGNSKALTYHWITNLAALAQVDTTVTADMPTYAVFKGPDRRTYTAFNPTNKRATVTFSDGTTLAVPPRQQTHVQKKEKR